MKGFLGKEFMHIPVYAWGAGVGVFALAVIVFLKSRGKTSQTGPALAQTTAAPTFPYPTTPSAPVAPTTPSPVQAPATPPDPLPVGHSTTTDPAQKSRANPAQVGHAIVPTAAPPIVTHSMAIPTKGVLPSTTFSLYGARDTHIPEAIPPVQKAISTGSGWYPFGATPPKRAVTKPVPAAHTVVHPVTVGPRAKAVQTQATLKKLGRIK